MKSANVNGLKKLEKTLLRSRKLIEECVINDTSANQVKAKALEGNSNALKIVREVIRVREVNWAISNGVLPPTKSE